MLVYLSKFLRYGSDYWRTATVKTVYKKISKQMLTLEMKFNSSRSKEKKNLQTKWSLTRWDANYSSLAAHVAAAFKRSFFFFF